VRASLRYALAMLGLLSRVSSAQARVLSAPPEPSLLNITRSWSRASSLGDLRELTTASDFLELRVWGGYGMGATQGVVLRRTGTHWSAFLARVRRCEMLMPRSAGDTASRATLERYVAQARRQCDTPVSDVGPGVRIITADTLAVERLVMPDSMIEKAWAVAVRAGALDLPGRIERAEAVSSDFTYVVEVRRGGEYRASAIEHVERPSTEADRQVRAVYAAVTSILPPELVLKP